MVSYSSREAVKLRLTTNGFKWAADRDRSGAVTENNKVDIVDPALSYADNIVNGAIARRVDLSKGWPTSNEWLADRATDIATYRAATQGGRRVPRVIREDYDRALLWLEDVRNGDMNVPGLKEDIIAVSSGKPRALNYSIGGCCNPQGTRRGSWPY